MKKAFKNATLLAAATALLGSIAACGTAPIAPQGQGFNPAQPGLVNRFATPNSRTGKKWTIAIHLAADNNLYRAGLDDLNEIEAGLAANPAAAEMIDVIVMFDGTPAGDSVIYRMKADPNGNNSTIVSEVIDDKGAVIPASKEVDSGSPETLNRFMDFVTKNFAAEHNSFSIWNHGSGIFRSNPTGDVEFGGTSFFDTIAGEGGNVRGDASKSFASDDHGGHMGLKDLNPALAIGAKNLGKPMDIFGFDTCLMQHVETAYQLKGLANILVASEELEPGDGWAYDTYIGALAKNPNLNPKELAFAMVDTYGISYRPGGTQRGRDVTLAALDVNQVANVLTPALANFASELKASLPTDKAAIDAARSKTQTFYNRDAADLGNFLSNLSATSRNPRLGAAASNLQNAMKATLINETHYGNSVDGATGFQVYFPTSTMSYNRRYDDVSQVRFAETQAWGDFLKAYTAR